MRGVGERRIRLETPCNDGVTCKQYHLQRATLFPVRPADSLRPLPPTADPFAARLPEPRKLQDSHDDDDHSDDVKDAVVHR